MSFPRPPSATATAIDETCVLVGKKPSPLDFQIALCVALNRTFHINVQMSRNLKKTFPILEILTEDLRDREHTSVTAIFIPEREKNEIYDAAYARVS